MIRFTFELPEKVSSNQFYAGTHWKNRKSWAEDFHDAIWAAIVEHKIPPLTKYPVRFTYHFTIPGNPLDISNLSGMVKMLEDGAIRAGLLEGDSPKYVNSITMTEEQGQKLQVQITIK